MNLSTLNPILARFTMEDSLLLRIEADAGNVDAVAVLFRKYGVPDAWRVAYDFCNARGNGREAMLVQVKE